MNQDFQSSIERSQKLSLTISQYEKELNKLKINNFSYIHLRMRSLSKMLWVPKTEETERWIQGITTYQKPKSRNLQETNTGVRNLTCNWQIAGGSEKVKTPREPSLEGTPHTCEFYLQFYQILTVKFEEKSLCTSLRGREKGTIFKYSQNILILLTKAAFKRNWSELYRNLTNTKKRKYQILILVSPKWGKKKKVGEEFVKVIAPEHRLTERMASNPRTTVMLPLPLHQPQY